MPNEQELDCTARKPVKVTFILDTDYVDKKCKLPELFRGRMLVAMQHILNYVGLDQYELITSDKPEYYAKMKDLGIPELWLHDTNHGDVAPYSDYYVLEFDDGSRKLCAIAPPEYDTIQGDPMFQ